MLKAANTVGVSSKTVHDHIKLHDRQTDSLGMCPKCRRIESVYVDVKAAR